MRIFKETKQKRVHTKSTGWIDTKLSEIKTNIRTLEDVDIVNKVSDEDINAVRAQILELQDFIGSKDSPSVLYPDMITELERLDLKLSELETDITTIEAEQETQNNDIGVNRENIELVGSDVQWIQAEQTLQNENITLNTSNITALTTVVENSSTGEFDGRTDGGIINEGVWSTIVWTQDGGNTFTNIIYDETTGHFTLTEDIPKLNFYISGQAENSGIGKEVLLRIWDVSTGTQVGNIQSQTVDDFGRIVYEDKVNVSAGEYRIEISATVGGGEVSFTSGRVELLKFGEISGGTVVRSSQLINDKVDDPTSGINPDLNKIDEKVDEDFTGTSYHSRVYRFSDGRAVIGNTKTTGDNNGVVTSNLLFSNSGAYSISQLDADNNQVQPVHTADNAIVLNYMLDMLIPIGTIQIGTTMPIHGTWELIGTLEDGQTIIGGSSSNGEVIKHNHRTLNIEYQNEYDRNERNDANKGTHTVDYYDVNGDAQNASFHNSGGSKSRVDAYSTMVGTDDKNRAWGLGLGTVNVYRRTA